MLKLIKHLRRCLFNTYEDEIEEKERYMDDNEAMLGPIASALNDDDPSS